MVLFRGLQPKVARATVITASQFAVYDQSKEVSLILHVWD